MEILGQIQQQGGMGFDKGGFNKGGFGGYDKGGFGEGYGKQGPY